MCTIQTIHLRFGRRGIAFLGPILRITGVLVLLWGPPFPVALLGYFVFGLGTGLTDAGFCAWGSGVPYTNVTQGIMHGSWSTGCVLGPAVVVLLSQKGLAWFAFYRVLVWHSNVEMLGLTHPQITLCVVECLALVVSFRNDDAKQYRAILDDDNDRQTSLFDPLRLKSTWMCGFYWFIYVGIECKSFWCLLVPFLTVKLLTATGL